MKSNIKEKDFSKFIEDKISKMTKFVQKENQINSLLAFGTLGNRSMRNYSDLNFILVTSLNSATLYPKIADLFSEKIFYSLQKPNRLLYYLNFESEIVKKTLEVELLICKRIEELKDIFIGSRFRTTDIPTIILVDKDDFSKKNLITVLNDNESFKNAIPEYIKERANDFVEYYIKGILNLNKTDLYQYYDFMSKTYAELLKLECIVQNNLEDLRNPIFGLARMDLDVDFPYYRKLLPNISLSDTYFRTEVIKKFKLVMEELAKRYLFDFKINQAIKVLEKIYKEGYFWNVRDISYVDSQYLKKGVLYRSSALSRYSGSEELENFLTTNKIKTIIDLRTEKEISIIPYKNITTKFDMVNVPIGPKDTIDLTQLKHSSPESSDKFYEAFLRFYQDEIRTIFETIANQEPGFVVHCHAGKDRTGIITALLLELLKEKTNGITEDLITEDYLNSGNNTNTNNLKVYRLTLKEFGGSKQYLKKIGISNESIEAIYKKFLVGS